MTETQMSCAVSLCIIMEFVVCEMQFAFHSWKKKLYTFVCIMYVSVRDMDPTSNEHIVKSTCREKKVYLNIKTVLSTGNSPESKLSWFVSVCLFPSS